MADDDLEVVWTPAWDAPTICGYSGGSTLYQASWTKLPPSRKPDARRRKDRVRQNVVSKIGPRRASSVVACPVDRVEEGRGKPRRSQTISDLRVALRFFQKARRP